VQAEYLPSQRRDSPGGCASDGVLARFFVDHGRPAGPGDRAAVRSRSVRTTWMSGYIQALWIIKPGHFAATPNALGS